MSRPGREWRVPLIHAHQRSSGCRRRHPTVSLQGHSETHLCGATERNGRVPAPVLCPHERAVWTRARSETNSKRPGVVATVPVRGSPCCHIDQVLSVCTLFVLYCTPAFRNQKNLKERSLTRGFLYVQLSRSLQRLFVKSFHQLSQLNSAHVTGPRGPRLLVHGQVHICAGLAQLALARRHHAGTP